MSGRDAVAAVLRRLGVAPGPPDLATLRRVHRALVATVPYDNLDIMLGQPPSVVPADCLDRLADGRRVGYCFHQNAALELLLTGLGYAVTRRRGRVWTDPARRDDDVLNHLVLEVGGLPAEGNPGGRWWVDAGLGEGFLDPVAVVAGEVVDGPYRLGIGAVTADGWAVRHDPAASFTGVDVVPGRCDQAAVGQAHALLSTPPEGTFTRVLVAARRDREGITVVRGCVVTRLDGGGSRSRDATAYEEWREALASVGVAADDVAEEDLRRLWRRTRLDHDAWVSAGRP